jgi:hypothetical protein
MKVKGSGIRVMDESFRIPILVCVECKTLNPDPRSPPPLNRRYRTARLALLYSVDEPMTARERVHKRRAGTPYNCVGRAEARTTQP